MELENLLIFFLIAVTIGKTPDSTGPLSLGISYLKLYGFLSSLGGLTTNSV